MPTDFRFDLFPEHTLRVFLFVEIKNGDEVWAKLRRKELLDMALINPKLILSELQILVAANKALHALKHNQLHANTVHSEIVFNLSPASNIVTSLHTFGVAPQCKEVLIGLLNPDEEKTEQIRRTIDGKEVDLSHLRELCEERLVKKHYKLTPEELTLGPHALLNGVVSRIAAKDVLNSAK